MAKNFYEACIEAGVKVEGHRSDLRIPVNETTRKLINDWKLANPDEKFFCEIFTCQITKEPWYSVAFQYQPFWDEAAIKLDKTS